jgi:hypothetical protein
VCTHTGFVILLFWTVQKLVRNRPPQWFESLLFCYFVILLFCYFVILDARLRPKFCAHSTPHSLAAGRSRFCYFVISDDFGRWILRTTRSRGRRRAVSKGVGARREERGKSCARVRLFGWLTCASFCARRCFSPSASTPCSSCCLEHVVRRACCGTRG